MLRSIPVLLSITLLSAADLKTVPPAGIAISQEDRAALEAGLRSLNSKIESIHSPLLPDVLIYREAVRYALQYNEFFKADEVAKAKQLLRAGDDRADALARGEAPWTTATGLVPRGYVSKIDRSIQPYGLYIPPGYSAASPHRWRLDAWFHGRSETLNEINFLTDRSKNPGEFTQPDAIVLYLYGRYCNASKFAGEVDFFEALDSVKKQYRIDENRILVRGFSMGGATTWHIAVHHAGLWAAAAPGAGFTDLKRYQKISDAEYDALPAWYTSLWHLYDAVDYAPNLYNTAVVAYSGEIDPQQMAANIMAEAMAREGLTLTHIIGPNTAHKYHPASKPIINAKLDAIAARGRDPYPRSIRFTTFTLAYNRMKWLQVDALRRHWERARVDAGIIGDRTIRANTSNVDALTIELGPGQPLLDPASKITIEIDGSRVEAPGPQTDRSFAAHLQNRNGTWTLVNHAEAGLHKRHGLQGPIDDAFMDSFIFVKPTGAAANPAVAAWVEAEMKRAIEQWRSQFRGEAQVRSDTGITDADIAGSNLVLWGDAASNRLIARIADRLPAGIMRKFSGTQVPLLIYPNPLNPNRYVVLNSGFTFREADYHTNSRQVPRLPDWAIVDVATPPDSRQPGKIVEAGFFDEQWRLR
jgi:pimeloyl-ACP methyl ester carboxylesterase